MDEQIKNLKSKLKELNLKHLSEVVDDFMLELCGNERSHIQVLQDALNIELENYIMRYGLSL